MNAMKDLTGQIFGRLKVVGIAERRRSRCGHLAIWWECNCSCGGVRKVSGGNLRTGQARSCGCLQKELAREKHTNHGEGKRGSRSTEYNSWTAMVNRCHNPNNIDYKDYGGRGISVCQPWRDYRDFLADMGRKPTPQHSIDRYPNPYGNYEPGNCRWASPLQQRHNRRNLKDALQTVQPAAPAQEVK